MSLRIFIIIAALLLGTTLHAAHPVEAELDVLLLHSYHQGFSWSDAFTDGVREQLKTRYRNIHLDIQYLDEKHAPGRHLWPHILEILRFKYQHNLPDIILAVDDAALQFLLTYHQSLFPDIPVVFGGVSHFEENWRQLRPQLTGVVERAAIVETVQLASRLHSRLRKVVLVNDGSTSGVQRHIQGVLDLEPYRDEFETEHWNELSLDELRSRLQTLDAETMVLLVSYYRDTRGQVIADEDLAQLAREHTRGPVYAFHEDLVGHGVVGGLVNQGGVHGGLVARLALRALEGTPVAQIPVMVGPARPLFDEVQLKHFRIDEERLPEESAMVNRPASFVARHQTLFELGFFLFLLLLVGHGASLVQLRIRARVAEGLRHNLTLLQTIIDSIPDPIFYKDDAGRYLGGNRQFYAALGLTREQVVGKTVYEVAPTELAKVYHQADMELLAQGGQQSYETRVRFADGQHHDVLFHKAVFPGEEGKAAGMVGAMLDISERKRMEDELRSREESFRLLFQTTPDPIILAGIDGRIIDVNRSFEEQSGISREEALGKTSQELDLWEHPEDRERMLEALRATGYVNNLEFEMQTRKLGARKGLFSARMLEFEGQPCMLFVVRDITQLRRAEDALEQSELRLRTVFEASPDAILISRAGGGGIIDVNEGFTSLWGYDRLEVLWRSTSELNMWADENARLRMREQLQRDGSVDNFEITIRCKDGSHRVCAASCRLVELDGHLSSLAVFRDITHFKAAEEALRESEQKFQAVFHQTYQFMAILDAQGRILEVNNTALQIYGLQPHDVEGLFFWETPWWSEGEQQQMIRLGVETAAHGNLFQVRTNHCKADGSLVHIDFSLKPVRDAWGEIVYLIPEGRDITGLYVAEQALRQSEKRYRELSGQFQAALDGVPDVMMLFDTRGDLVWGNQSAMKVFGLTKSDQGHKNCRQIWGEKEQCATCSHATFVEGRPWEELVETQKGQSWGIKTFPIKDDRGAVVNVLQIATDLTEKIRLREQASRSAHLAALGEVAAGVAHEINNPAGLMLMDLGLLQDVYFDLVPIIEQHREEHGEFECGGLSVGRALEQIPPVFSELRDGAERIKRIVAELKEFANPHADALQQAVDLNEVVNRALRLTRKSLDTNCRRIEIELAEKLPLIAGNTQRLEQVVINLLLNAAQAVSGVGEMIRVATSYRARHKVVVVSVTDDGRGIPADKLALITDPFFTTRREEGGTGLGLSVSSRIIDEHHGVLNFSSQVGKGTTVTIELPITAPEEG